MPAAAIEFKYPLGTCLHEGDRDAIFETECDGKPAIVEFLRPESSFESAKLISRYAAAAKLRHPNIVRVLDYGEAEVFETAVVFLVTERGYGTAIHPKSDIAAALHFLHANGYAHGSVGVSSSIVPFGETAKLSPSTIQLASQGEKEDDIEALDLLFGGKSEPGSAVPIYRRHAGLAIGGVVAAGALCLMLVRNAEHKAPPPPPPVIVHQQPLRPEVVKAEPVRQIVTLKAVHHKRTRHKRR